MKIHEYQALALFQEYGVPVPKGKPAFSPRTQRGRFSVSVPSVYHASNTQYFTF